DLLIEGARAQIEAGYVREPADAAFRELLFGLFPYPERLRLIAPFLYASNALGLQGLAKRFGLFKFLPPRFRQLAEMAPPLTLSRLLATLPAFTPARGTKRGRVAVIAGCVQRVFFPNVNAATVRVLAAEGFDVVVPAAQGCCGALSLHVGRDGEARDFARALLRAFANGDEVDAVIINAAGCGSTLKQYAELLAGDPEFAEPAARFSAKVKDVNEFLAGVEPVALRRSAPIRVAYHDACHLAHAQRIREEPRRLLCSIPDLKIVEIPQGDQCCGSAGVYNLLQPESASEIGERKVDNLLSIEADMLASANPGCTLQIQSILAKRGRTLLAAHPIEILDATLV
ncbi:MAG TPA: heterodisulfide reductase-related iron-sulfur binding cluster, partial [Candidatus Baltobacteraceae bacterium]|nr:heterodisulfide reductase-related iron-sulfur binding cluster [Candidatus Baltobacteraceae bacterium]